MAPLLGPSFRNVKKVIASISIFYTNADQLLNKMMIVSVSVNIPQDPSRVLCGKLLRMNHQILS